MKTYLMNLTKEVRNWSNSLDARSILCSKSWLVFNEEGKKEVFVFEKDGSLIISVDGIVTKAFWKYIPVNSSLVITTDKNDSYMLNPFSYDDKVFTLQLDGTEKYSFLVDQQEVEKLRLTTLTAIDCYINHHSEYERQLINAEAEMKRQKEEAKYKARLEWKQEIDRRIEEWKKTSEFKTANARRILKLRIGIAVGIILFLIGTIMFVCCDGERLKGISVVFLIGLSFIVFIGLLVVDGTSIIDKKRQQLEHDNPFVYKE